MASCVGVTRPPLSLHAAAESGLAVDMRSSASSGGAKAAPTKPAAVGDGAGHGAAHGGKAFYDTKRIRLANRFWDEHIR